MALISSSVRRVRPRPARASVTRLVPLVLLAAATLAVHRLGWEAGSLEIGAVILALVGAVLIGSVIVGVRQGYDETGRDRP
jgi:hypothetical protein